jgi:molybdopterin converting factor small subunit
MTVTLLLFASYADALGVSSLDMELASESTVGELLSAIRARPARSDFRRGHSSR